MNTLNNIKNCEKIVCNGVEGLLAFAWEGSDKAAAYNTHFQPTGVVLCGDNGFYQREQARLAALPTIQVADGDVVEINGVQHVVKMKKAEGYTYPEFNKA